MAKTSGDVTAPKNTKGGASGRVRLWLLSTAYVLVFSLALSYLFFPGVMSVSAGNVPVGIVFICLSTFVCYFSTAIYLAFFPKQVLTGLCERTFSESFTSLPKLIAVLGIFALGFAVLSGLVSVLVFYVLAAGLSEAERQTPVLAGVVIVLLLSLPFFARAFSGFAAGEMDFKRLFTGSLRVGAALYLRYLVLSAIVFGLALMLRVFIPASAGPAASLLTLILTSLVFGAAIPASWIIYEMAVRRMAAKGSIAQQKAA